MKKSFGNIQALRDLDLVVEENEIYGFLGPNGAGKTTTINILLDFIKPSDGEVKLLGHDSRRESFEIKRKIGFLPERISLYDRLTGKRQLEFVKKTKGADVDLDGLLERVGLEGEGDKKTGKYSKGMKQRLGLAISLIGEPELLILDEPTTGLDPHGKRMVRDIIKEENKRGATIFFSTHILEQAEKISDRVGIIRGGELIAEGTMEELREQVGAESYLRIETDKRPNIDSIEKLEGIKEIEVMGNEIKVKVEENMSFSDFFGYLESQDVKILGFETENSSLEDLFAILTRE
ncbi:ABC transporter ATP-binding protein [archaeon SCG-AAA382B04]|nr:ABC transporter ATP-binding protein [archaeon SCG-AAA382B04]